jgi:hypothetical protein
MRRPIGFVLVGMGVFVIAAGMLARFYVFPRLAVLPYDNYAVTESRAENATYFDATTLKERRGRTMIAIHTIRGDLSAASDVAVVWDSFDFTKDADGTPISYNQSTVALDRRKAEAVNCCGQSLEGDYTIQRSGLLYQWPFYTQKKSYPYFDETLRKTLPINYDRTDRLYGVEVYRFVQRIEPVQIGALDVPGIMMGEPTTPMVKATRWYQIERTFWIEPRTGVIVKAQDQRKQTLRNPDGQDVVTLVDATMVLSDRDVRRFTKRAGDGSVKIFWLHDVAPWAGLGLGLVLIVAGLPLAVSRRREPEPAPSFRDEDTQPLPVG